MSNCNISCFFYQLALLPRVGYPSYGYSSPLADDHRTLEPYLYLISVDANEAICFS